MAQCTAQLGHQFNRLFLEDREQVRVDRISQVNIVFVVVQRRRAQGLLRRSRGLRCHGQLRQAEFNGCSHGRRYRLGLGNRKRLWHLLHDRLGNRLG